MKTLLQNLGRIGRASGTGLLVSGWLCPVNAFAGEPVSQPTTIELTNHHEFPLRQPIQVRLSPTPPGNWQGSQKQPVQFSKDGAVLIADLPANGRQRVELRPGSSRVREAALSVTPDADGVALQWRGQSFGRLAWSILVRPTDLDGASDEAIRAAQPDDFDATFEPLPLAFHQNETGPVFSAWSASATRAGLSLRIELRAYPEGFLDLQCQFTNESADPRKKVYAAVVCRWEQPAAGERVHCYDNHIAPLAERAWSRFRRGEGRHQFALRGVDWVRIDFGRAGSAAWLMDFAPSFTVLDKSTRNTFKQPRYTGANVPQLGQELQTAGNRLYSITEIARPNIRSYRDRVVDNTLPARSEGAAFSSRLVFSRSRPTDRQTDQMLIGYTSYHTQRDMADGVAVSFGVPSVRFGTSYLPYSTLGENFDFVKLPGMDREGFWPLAADTVLRWREFADEIRRDLRLAKMMGFQVIRLHYLDVLAPIPKAVREEYLDFFFAELRQLQLKAMLSLPAADTIPEIVARYSDVVDSVEFENEVLIWGIPLDRVEQWKQGYADIKKAAPHVQVNLTGFNNNGIFNRLQSLGVPFDRVGMHNYTDSLEAIPTARGYALGLGSFCAKFGKPPVVTEWNWRGLTRLTPEDRAARTAEIFENALAMRSIPEFHQFQFNETLAVNPNSGRGNLLRHYEPIHLSRRLKPKAFELIKLIRKYSAPDEPVRVLDIPQVIVNLDARGQGQTTVKIKNISPRPLRLTAAIESPASLQATGKIPGTLNLKPGRTLSLPLTLKTVGTTPGFYHCFVRMESSEGEVCYGSIEARLVGAPKLDLGHRFEVTYPRGVAAELQFDWTGPVAVVYGKGAPVLEAETAIAIASTLESAVGRPVGFWQADTLPAGHLKTHRLILVGTPQSHPIIAEAAKRASNSPSFVASVQPPDAPQRLVVGGHDSRAVQLAGTDLLLRWWTHAKDSAARRVGLVEKKLPRIQDPAKLP